MIENITYHTFCREFHYDPSQKFLNFCCGLLQSVRYSSSSHYLKKILETVSCCFCPCEFCHVFRVLILGSHIATSMFYTFKQLYVIYSSIYDDAFFRFKRSMRGSEMLRYASRTYFAQMHT